MNWYKFNCTVAILVVAGFAMSLVMVLTHTSGETWRFLGYALVATIAAWTGATIRGRYPD